MVERVLHSQMKGCGNAMRSLNTYFMSLGLCIDAYSLVTRLSSAVHSRTPGCDSGLTPVWDERLRGIDLGVLAGLSRAEAAQRWPMRHNGLSRGEGDNLGYTN